MPTHQNIWLFSGILSALMAVVVAAIGAHGPMAPTVPELQRILATASLFHLTHSLALIQFGLWRGQNPNRDSLPGWLFIAGIALFAGTLYGLVFSTLKIPGVLTPIGGGLLILAWLIWGYQVLRTPRH